MGEASWQFLNHTAIGPTDGTFMEYDKLTTGKLTFLVASRFSITRRFYELANLTKEDVPNIALSFGFAHIEKSSVTGFSELIDRDSGEIFASKTAKLILVDKESRLPTPIDGWWREKYAPILSGDNYKNFNIRPFKVAENPHVHEVKVAWDDVDGYMHVNYSVFPKYCAEAAMDVAVAGGYTKLSNDVLRHHVKDMEIIFMKEMWAGDKMQVAAWENPDDPYKVHFNISEAGSTVCQSTVTFHQC